MCATVHVLSVFCLYFAFLPYSCIYCLSLYLSFHFALLSCYQFCGEINFTYRLSLSNNDEHTQLWRFCYSGAVCNNITHAVMSCVDWCCQHWRWSLRQPCTEYRLNVSHTFYTRSAVVSWNCTCWVDWICIVRRREVDWVLTISTRWSWSLRNACIKPLTTCVTSNGQQCVDWR